MTEHGEARLCALTTEKSVGGEDGSAADGGRSLRDLEARLAAAVGPDRELDACLWLATTPGATRKATLVNHHTGPYTIDETRVASGRLIVVPEYTSSIDAALTLVPEGCEWWVQTYRDGRTEAAILSMPKEPHYMTLDKPGGFTRQDSGYMPTAPLAICLAAVRARITPPTTTPQPPTAAATAQDYQDTTRHEARPLPISSVPLDVAVNFPTRPLPKAEE